MTTTVERVFRSWERGRGALLYGPPGTGKTRALGELFRALADDEEDATVGMVLDPDDAASPLQRPKIEPPIPLPAKVVWATFHQSFTYEDWIIGMRPEPTGAGLQLRPRMGVLLDGIYEVLDENSGYKSLVVLVDELNRGNAARIFGEFLTFLDCDYRLDKDGGVGELTLPLPLRQVSIPDHQTEPMLRPNGEEVSLDWPVYFPYHVYFVGTMNSVDRAAIPIDSALARRFERIEMSPDLQLLATWFELDLTDLSDRALLLREPDSSDWEDLGPYETAVLLLDRINGFIASEIGSDFELGHGLLMSIRSLGEDDRWMLLARAWDEVIFPQLEDRFAGRPEELLTLLKVENPPTGEYAFNMRTGIGGSQYGRALGRAQLAEVSSQTRRRSLRWLSV